MLFQSLKIIVKEIVNDCMSSLFPNEGILTKEIESWKKCFVNSLSSKEEG
jgi:hypothetical protein